MDLKNQENNPEISNITFQDSIGVYDSYGISAVYRAGTLKLCACKLVEIAKESNDKDGIYCLVTAAIIMCSSAIEATLFQFAHVRKIDVYNLEDFRTWGIRRKYKKLTGRKFKTDFKEANKIIAIRDALIHNEPDNSRELELINNLTVDTSLKAIQTTDNFIKKMLGNKKVN